MNDPAEPTPDPLGSTGEPVVAPSEIGDFPISSNLDQVRGGSDERAVDQEPSHSSGGDEDAGRLNETGQQETKSRKKRRRRRRTDSMEQRLLGRRSICKSAADIAPQMLKTVKMRVLGRLLESKRGMDDAELTEKIINNAGVLVSEDHVIAAASALDSDVHRRNLKDIIVYVILLQEETYSLEERKLDERVQEYERRVIETAKNLDFFDTNRHDDQRAHNCDTYRIVLEAAWRNNDDISLDEAELLRVLRERLGISAEDHRLISAHIDRFPKTGFAVHTRDEIHDARKELQRAGIVWSYRDDNNRNIDVIGGDPFRGGKRTKRRNTEALGRRATFPDDGRCRALEIAVSVGDASPCRREPRTTHGKESVGAGRTKSL